jgi:glycosyltransferase involved in cell wall biosynthesis
MDTPLVTVICLCYNHEAFLKEAIDSVFTQRYPAIQLIVVDDASTDSSAKVIKEILKEHPEILFLSLKSNVGNCKAFNKGFEQSTGRFIIDLAADDALMPDRIQEGINAFERSGAGYGVNFSDAELIDESGSRLGFHSDQFPHTTIPQGDVYQPVIERYFINSPTMMMRREVLVALGGYDETLAYEDFDFWVRSSRDFLYTYTPKPLVRRRMLKTSMASNQYKRNSLQLASTYEVCKKIEKLNRNTSEDKSLRKRILYEMRKAITVGEFQLSWKYLIFLYQLIQNSKFKI